MDSYQTTVERFFFQVATYASSKLTWDLLVLFSKLERISENINELCVSFWIRNIIKIQSSAGQLYVGKGMMYFNAYI